MTVSLLGLMAIAMFYIVTVVVGLCANRCLKREEDFLEETPKVEAEALQPIRREGSTEQELVELQELEPSDSETQSPCTSRSVATHSRRHLTGNGFSPTRDAAGNHLSRLADGEILMERVGDFRNPQREEQRLVRSSTEESLTSQPPKIPVAGKFLLAERNIGVVFGSLSILAIRTGGVFSSSISEEVFSQGLLWCHVPVASSISLIIGGLLFARQLYSECFVTMVDPFQAVYGRRVGALIALPILCAEILFSACVLSSLGSMMEYLLGLSHSFGAISSLCAVMCYLVAGGLYAGTFTDAVQFVYLCLGLWLLFPFAMLKSSDTIATSFPKWLGRVDGKHAGLFIDQLVMLILGGIPMQSYFQRVLACRSSRGPRVMTIVGSLGCLVNAIPAILTGAAAVSTDWNSTSYGMRLDLVNSSDVLYISMATVLPGAVAFICVGALASGLIASCDSALLGAATVIAHNVYKTWLRPNAGQREVVWICRGSILVLSLIVLALALIFKRIHTLWLLPYDILYVLIFPQLFCVVYFKYANTYGALAGLIAGTAVRTLTGCPSLRLPALLTLPFHDTLEGQLFPYRTLAMLSSLCTIIFVSMFYHWLYYRGTLSSSQDVFVCFSSKNSRQEPEKTKRETVERMTVV